MSTPNQSHTTPACKWSAALPTSMRPSPTPSKTVSAATRLFSLDRDEVYQTKRSQSMKPRIVPLDINAHSIVLDGPLITALYGVLTNFAAVVRHLAGLMGVVGVVDVIHIHAPP